MKTIAIWAPLRYANYGDDMQAIAVALLLKRNGYNVKLFQLDNSLAKSYNLNSVSTVEELCKDINLCIIAGGALLTPLNIAKRWLHPTYREYEKDFRDLYQATLKYDIKFCAISIGGDGMIRNPILFYGNGRRKLFNSTSFLDGTVRLEGDVAQMKKAFGKSFTYFPDMLFHAKEFFPPQLLPPSTKYRVGFNFKKGHYIDDSLLHAIYKYAANHNDMEFHFTTTHMQKTGLKYQYVPIEESKNIYIDKYESPCQLLGILSSMDCFMTSMLHVGLTGITCGTPFLSYRGPGKTKTFLKSIGGEWAILPDNISFEQLKTLFWNQKKESLYNKFDVSVLEKMKQDSMKHFDFCLNIAEKYA